MVSLNVSWNLRRQIISGEEVRLFIPKWKLVVNEVFFVCVCVMLVCAGCINNAVMFKMSSLMLMLMLWRTVFGFSTAPCDACTNPIAADMRHDDSNQDNCAMWSRLTLSEQKCPSSSNVTNFSWYLKAHTDHFSNICPPARWRSNLTSQPYGSSTLVQNRVKSFSSN